MTRESTHADYVKMTHWGCCVISAGESLKSITGRIAAGAISRMPTVQLTPRHAEMAGRYAQQYRERRLAPDVLAELDAARADYRADMLSRTSKLVAIPTPLHDELEAAAELAGVSTAELVALALREKLEATR